MGLVVQVVRNDTTPACSVAGATNPSHTTPSHPNHDQFIHVYMIYIDCLRFNYDLLPIDGTNQGILHLRPMPKF